ncbi:hypothetical protein [Ligilactobacillus murinus]|uniref:hypothetical protein n=1 Tax=Ligilactobacillus murinus TaxID=1622 RepID=UPI002DD66586|nr:hypothetical protein [Ligilactobacillus murinus]WRY38104.1 hypothetical protein P8F80_01845 [Ligilactobacillus murinus]
MTKDDILAYLSQQMQRTQGVYVAEQNLARRQEIYNETKQMWKKRIIACFVLGVMGLGSNLVGALLFIGIGCALLYFKHKKVTEAENDIAQIRSKLAQLKNQDEYRAGLDSFPSKFYNYALVSRLLNLVYEERALTLQDAYNILENQLHNEHQENLAEQNLRAVQNAETYARNASWAASISAFNSFRK